MESKAIEIKQELEKYIDPIKREYLPKFFKTGKGQYGEGDKFLGITVPNIRLVAKKYKDESIETTAELLQSEWHDCRLCALLILVERFKKSDEEERGIIYDFYLSQTKRINNWDLVDLSAPNIMGAYLLDKPRDKLYSLAASPLLWEQRIAVVSTITLIKHNDFIDIIRLSEMLLNHKHDLMHKAVGWMLREMGKKDNDLLVQFLEKHAAVMPRTMLRYAIEKFEEEERRYYMGLKKK
jgi:3-methyladenine DNA glycosylase AlkD